MLKTYYIFPALFSVSQGRKITLSGVSGFTDVRTENSIESIRFSSARTYTTLTLFPSTKPKIPNFFS